jgi:acyl-CoA thioesterase FadM
LHYDDEVETQVTVERVGESSFTLYFMSIANGAAVARGRITAVCMSITTQRSTPLPEGLAEALRLHRG